MSDYDSYQRAGDETLHGAAAFQARLKDGGGIQRRDQDNYLRGWKEGYAEGVTDGRAELHSDMASLQAQVRALTELMREHFDGNA